MSTDENTVVSKPYLKAFTQMGDTLSVDLAGVDAVTAVGILQQITALLSAEPEAVEAPKAAPKARKARKKPAPVAETTPAEAPDYAPTEIDMGEQVAAAEAKLEAAAEARKAQALAEAEAEAARAAEYEAVREDTAKDVAEVLAEDDAAEMATPVIPEVPETPAPAPVVPDVVAVVAGSVPGDVVEACAGFTKLRPILFKLVDSGFTTADALVDACEAMAPTVGILGDINTKAGALDSRIRRACKTMKIGA